ncbi:hypothetical protein D3C81_1102660 [compost metagenome]
MRIAKLLVGMDTIQLAATFRCFVVVLLHSFDVISILCEKVIQRKQRPLSYLLLKVQPVSRENQVKLVTGGHHQIRLVGPRSPIDWIKLDRNI